MTLRPFIIDCDTGRDDALALWTAMAMNAPLAAVVTSYGNTSLENVTDNTARVLGLFSGDDIPLWACATAPAKDHKGYQNVVIPRQKAAGNGICNIELPVAERSIPDPISAVELAENIKTLAAKHGPLDYIILGPATNLAAACNVLGEDAVKYIARITMMGGTLDHMWEELSAPDFNIICDPFAIKTLFETAIDMRFVSLSTTWPIKMSLTELEALQTDSSHTLAEISKTIMITHTRDFAPEPIFRFHDPAVIVAAQDDTTFKPHKISIIDDENHDEFGRLIYDEENGYDIGLHYSNEAIGQHILSTILGGLGITVSSEKALRNAG